MNVRTIAAAPAFAASARSIAIAVVMAMAMASGGCARRVELPATDVSAASTFPASRIERGERLAAVGDCFGCHTTAEGRPYAGGVPIATPFGTVHGTNITPDPDTGIGRWSLAAFTRALREGVARDGRHLYPAFPYPHFRTVTDDDVEALYAFLMTREPVRAETPPNTMMVPRSTLALWNALYLDDAAAAPSVVTDATAPVAASAAGTAKSGSAAPGSAAPDTAAGSDPVTARGRYLVEGLGHCGACHSPRNALGAEKHGTPYSGGDADGWHAPALGASSPSPIPWTVDALADYLRHGIADGHALAAGPMSVVVRNLARASDDDLRAMAVYVASLDRRSIDQRTAQQDRALSHGARGPATPAGLVPGVSLVAGQAVDPASGLAIYDGSCAQCHDRGRDAEGGALQLPLAVALSMPTPSNLVRIIRDGIVPAERDRMPWMPDYAGTLTDAQLASLVAYLRTFTGLPAWHGIEGAVKSAKEAGSQRPGKDRG